MVYVVSHTEARVRDPLRTSVLVMHTRAEAKPNRPIHPDIQTKPIQQHQTTFFGVFLRISVFSLADRFLNVRVCSRACIVDSRTMRCVRM